MRYLVAVASLVVILLSHTTWAQRELWQSFIQECERDEFKVGSKRMILFSREENWSDAKDHCEKIGRRLLTTTTKKEVDDLKDYLNFRIWGGRPYRFHYWNLWLAATDLDPKGIWTWQTTKQEVNLTYSSWADGEPSGGNEHCMELKLINYDDTWWNDHECEVKKRYICEIFDGGLN